MSSLRSFKRRLDPNKVWLAQQVAIEKVKIARQFVVEHAKKDAAFAADVLKAVGNNLPKEIKKACEESVKSHAPIVSGDTSHELTEAIQLDGGGVIMVRPEEAPGYPKDGEKLVFETGPTLEKLSEEPDPEDQLTPPPPGAIIDGLLPPRLQKFVDEHIKKV